MADRRGLATTAEAKANRANAARARWGQPPVAMPQTPGDSPITDLRTIAEHDAKIGQPVSWGDALKRMQLIEQDIINERREIELETAQAALDEQRGRLVERAELDKLAAKIRDSWWSELAIISGLVLAKFSDLPMEIRARLKQGIDQELAAASERVRMAMIKK